MQKDLRQKAKQIEMESGLEEGQRKKGFSSPPGKTKKTKSTQWQLRKQRNAGQRG